MAKYYNTFIVKISDGSITQPRGYVQHVGTQETKYIKSFVEMDRFIAEHLGPPASGGTGKVTPDSLQNKPTGEQGDGVN